MRWDNLLAGTDGDQDGDTETAVLPLFPGEAIVRRFKTPQFRGMTFYEVAAKSIINHVPGDRYGFSWTINPFRGCSHACSYCLAGDTPVLLAGGGTRPLAEIEAGDEVYGTVKAGNARRYVPTVVTDHWSTVRPAHRVTLADGTQLVTSADHRFLTSRGWKHVTGTEQGPGRRPHLTPGIDVIGTGGFPRPPAQDDEYCLGYLRGLVGQGVVVRECRAVIEFEAERRACDYFACGITARQVVGGEASGVGSPGLPGPSWSKGFLAGLFDRAGGERGRLVTATSDRSVVAEASSCLRTLGFRCRVEQRSGETLVLVDGDLAEALRFLLTVDPAISRKRSVEGVAIRRDAPLRVVSVEPLGVDLPLYDVTTGTGDFIADGVVSHNCFARPTHTYLEFDAGRDFETRIVVKVNAAELLRRELRRASWKGELIAMGTNTDPYQRAEGHYKLMRGILTELNAARNPYSILTKGTLIQRDLDLLVQGASVTEVSANFSVGTVDETVWESTEPGTPHPLKRLEVVRMMNDAGIPCGVLMAPILPGISDSPDQLKATVKACAEAGATHVTPLTLHLRPGVKEEFLPWLKEHHPELVTRYARAYRGSYAPKEVTEPIGRQVAELRRTYGVARMRPTGGRGGAPTGEATEAPAVPGGPGAPSPEPEAPAEQMSLDLGAVQPRKAPARTALRGRSR